MSTYRVLVTVVRAPIFQTWRGANTVAARRRAMQPRVTEGRTQADVERFAVAEAWARK